MISLMCLIERDKTSELTVMNYVKSLAFHYCLIFTTEGRILGVNKEVYYS